MGLVKQAKGWYIAVSILIILLGIALIALPSSALKVLSVITGVLMIIGGMVRVLSFFTRDTYALAFQFDLALGIIMLIVGLLLVLIPNGVLRFFDIIVGVFVLIDGAFKIQTAIDARWFGLSCWWMIIITAIITMACGIVLIVVPFSAVKLLMIFAGAALVIDGAQNLFNVLYTVRIHTKRN